MGKLRKFNNLTKTTQVVEEGLELEPVCILFYYGPAVSLTPEDEVPVAWFCDDLRILLERICRETHMVKDLPAVQEIQV